MLDWHVDRQWQKDPRSHGSPTAMHSCISDSHGSRVSHRPDSTYALRHHQLLPLPPGLRWEQRGKSANATTVVTPMFVAQLSWGHELSLASQLRVSAGPGSTRQIERCWPTRTCQCLFTELDNGPLFRLCTCFHGLLLLVFVNPSDFNGGDALKLRVRDDKAGFSSSGMKPMNEVPAKISQIGPLVIGFKVDNTHVVILKAFEFLSV